MTSALRWAAMRAILMFHNCEGQSHKTVSTDHNFWSERRAEADSNRGPSAYEPNALPLGQTDSQEEKATATSNIQWLEVGHHRCISLFLGIWWTLFRPLIIIIAFEVDWALRIKSTIKSNICFRKINRDRYMKHQRRTWKKKRLTNSTRLRNQKYQQQKDWRNKKQMHTPTERKIQVQ